MTKMEVNVDEKAPLPSPATSAPLPVVMSPPAYLTPTQFSDTAEMRRSSTWYVLSVLATIFCCLPCGVVGIVHAMLAHHDGELGRVPSQRIRLRKAKCWTCTSFALGLLVLIATVLYTLYVYGVFNSACAYIYESS